MPRLFGNVINASWWCWLAVGGQETGIAIHPDGHEGRADQKWHASSPSIDEDQGKDCHPDVDDILDGGGNETSVAAQTSHTEDVDDIVHHHIHTLTQSQYNITLDSGEVHTCELRPNLSEDTDVGAVDHVRFEEFEIGHI